MGRSWCWNFQEGVRVEVAFACWDMEGMYGLGKDTFYSAIELWVMGGR